MNENWERLKLRVEGKDHPAQVLKWNQTNGNRIPDRFFRPCMSDDDGVLVNFVRVKEIT